MEAILAHAIHTKEADHEPGGVLGGTEITLRGIDVADIDISDFDFV